MAVAIPLGYINLEDNMKFQWASLAGLLGFTGVFFVQFLLCIQTGSRWQLADPSWVLAESLPPFRASGQYQVLGIATFIDIIND